MVLVIGTFFLTSFGEKYVKNGQAGKSGNVSKKWGLKLSIPLIAFQVNRVPN